MPTLAEAAERNSTEKPSTVPNHTKADVYRNLQRSKLSVRSRETDTYGVVIAHCDSIIIRDAEFVVSESQRDTAREENRKNVHAVVRGVVDSTAPCEGNQIPVTYDPFEYDWFVHAETEAELATADAVRIDLSDRQFYAYNPTYRNTQ